jgi:hypothetical protein
VALSHSVALSITAYYTNYMKESAPPRAKTKTNPKVPIGIIVVLIFILLELVMLSRLLSQSYMLPIANIVLSTGAVKLYFLASVAILISAIVGIIRRNGWSRILIISWYIYNAILAAINYATFQMSPDKLIVLYQQFKPEGVQGLGTVFVSRLLFIAMIFIWVTGGAISFYLYRQKRYFNK